MRRGLALLLTATLALSMTACGGSKGAGTQKSEKGDGMTYAVEAGSAGEAVAKEKGFNYNSVSSQADALMEVKSGTSDAAIIDLLMAGAMIGEGTSYPDLVHTTELTSEKYGVGCRKGSDLASYINSVFAESYADGSAQEIAKKYGVQDSLLEQEPCEFKQSDSDSDVDYIKSQGKMIVGITEFEPMDYKDKDDKWIGFDADMARLVGEKLGVDVEFVVIDWDNKVMELDSKKIDVVWHGMTLTDNEEFYKKMMLFRSHGITRDENLITRNDGSWFYQQLDLGYKDVHCRNAERIYSHIISLPLYPTLTMEEQDYVIQQVCECTKNE